MSTPTLRLPARTLRVLDLALAVWVLVWIVLGLRVGAEVRGLSDLSETVTRSGTAVVESSEGLRALEGAPFVGDQIEETADRVREAGESAQASGRSSRDSVRDLSILLGLAIGVIPSLPVIGFYLPLRVARVREVRAVRRALRGRPGDPHLLALLATRAARNLSYCDLLELSPDPLGDIAAGRYQVFAEAELRRLGLDPAEQLAQSVRDGGRAARRRAEQRS